MFGWRDLKHSILLFFCIKSLHPNTTLGFHLLYRIGVAALLSNIYSFFVCPPVPSRRFQILVWIGCWVLPIREMLGFPCVLCLLFWFGFCLVVGFLYSFLYKDDQTENFHLDFSQVFFTYALRKSNFYSWFWIT